MFTEKRRLGRTELEVGRLGLAASYGRELKAADVERGFEEGMNYLYWGSFRTAEFGAGLRNLKSRRERVVLVLQSYLRLEGLLGWSVERGLRRLGYEYTDVLLLGMWNKPVSRRVLEGGLELKRRGLVRHLAVSTHNRKLAPELGRTEGIDIVHVRYNAAHTGAERDIFPNWTAGEAGLVSFTATRWGQLLAPKRTPKGEKTPTAADCYRFVLSRDEVDVCLTGPKSAAEMAAAGEAARLGKMTEEELEWMRRVGRQVYAGSLRK